MGQKIKPIGIRLGINRTWDSRWYADRNYATLLHQDRELREHLMERLKAAAISRVVIERPAGRARITIYAGRPGLIIGKKGADIEVLRADLAKRIGSEVSLNIVEVRKPEIDAKLVAESIAQQLERRVAFRRAMKRAVQSAMRLGALVYVLTVLVVLVVLRLLVQNGIVKAVFHFIHFVLKLIMVKQQHTQLMVLVVSKFGSSKVKSSFRIQWHKISVLLSSSLLQHRETRLKEDLRYAATKTDKIPQSA